MLTKIVNVTDQYMTDVCMEVSNLTVLICTVPVYENHMTSSMVGIYDFFNHILGFIKGKWDYKAQRPRKWPLFSRYFQMLFLHKYYCILIQISLSVVPEGSIDYKLSLVLVMAWRHMGDKPYITWTYEDQSLQYEMMLLCHSDFIRCHCNYDT